MDVQLYVYDLSKGLARQLSLQFLGTQIDAVYHTALVFGGIEYFFGAGVQTCYPGTTHHGQPMEVIPLGKTDLPMEVILEYLDSLKEIYTAESYDLFMHNCNNFSHDFAMFLVGKGIPDHITSLPQTVLNTPFGQMLRPQLDSAMRTVTQAPVPAPQVPRQPTASRPAATNGTAKPLSPTAPVSKVHNVTALSDVQRLLESANKSSAVIFFTSSTCAPCKLVYPAYDDLAAEAGDKCVLIKVDINHAHEVASRYSVRATPTFMTFLRSQKQEEWSGADERKLRANVRMLLDAAFPPHPHLSLSTPKLLSQSLRPITYPKVPPLDKLVTKMGNAGKDTAVTDMVSFIKTRESSGAIEAPLPSLPAFSRFLVSATETLPPELLFTALDLLRAAIIDPRVAGFFAEEHAANSSTPTTITKLLQHVNNLGTGAPYNLRLTALHLACNLFTSHLFHPHILSPPLSGVLITFLTSALLDEKHPALRVSALSLALNISSINHSVRMKKHSNSAPTAHGSELPEEEQVELSASLLEILSPTEDGESEEVKKMAVVALGWLVYCADVEGEVRDLCLAMDAGGTVEKVDLMGDKGLVKEVVGLVEGWGRG